MTVKTANCAQCDNEFTGTNRQKYCDRCKSADKHRHRNRRIPTMFVGVDCESAKNQLRVDPRYGPENDIVTFSYGREDGSAGSIMADLRDFVSEVEVYQWMRDELSGIYETLDGDVYRQALIGFHFNHDIGMLLKRRYENTMLVHKSTAKKRGLLCGSDHPEPDFDSEDGERCGKLHRYNPVDCNEILRNGGESDYIAWDPESRFGFSSTSGRRFYMEWRPYGDRFEGNRRVDVHDIAAAFPGKFEAVIDKWQPEMRPGDREIVAWGKQQRVDAFFDEDREKIASYSEAECVLLARLGRKLIKALKAATGLEMDERKLFGSGSVAAEVMKFNGVPTRLECHVDNTMVRGIEIDHLPHLTYYGGKIEAPTIGFLTQDAHPRDINSAYPSKMVTLPCMRAEHGQWRWGRDIDPLVPDHTPGYVLADWALPEGSTQIPPFMVRRRNGSVLSPLAGTKTWVHLAEYRTAVSYWGEYVFPRQFVWWEKTCDCPPPMAFLADVYQKRFEYKALARDESLSESERLWNTALEEVCKLVINSCYGKLAERDPQLGRLTNLHWAAQITAETRSQVNIEIWEGEKLGGTPVYVHTDSVSFVNLEREDEGKALGRWGKEAPKKRLFIAQPGLAVSTISDCADPDEHQRKKEWVDGQCVVCTKAATRGVSKGVVIPVMKAYAKDETKFLQAPEHWPAMHVEDNRMFSLRYAHHIGKPWLAGSFTSQPLDIGFVTAKREFYEAKPMGAENPYAWMLPPRRAIQLDEQAQLEDLQSFRNMCRQERESGLWDETPLRS